MRKVKYYLYIINLGLGIVYFFFKTYFPVKIVLVLQIIVVISMIIILILEVVTYLAKKR
jgi:hypothetical protein